MKILVIDDEKISRKVLLTQLAGLGDCTAVGSSKKGVVLIEKSLEEKAPWDLVTIDVSMPKMDGRQLLQRIRRKEKELEIKKKDRMKIVMVTSRMNVSTIKECIRLGCDGYLSKPVNKYQLLDSLGKIGFSDLPKVEEKEGHTQTVSKIIKLFYDRKISLPVLPGIVDKINELMANQVPDIDAFARIVEKDILISSKLISIANSSLYRGVEKVDSLNTALIRLGIKTSSRMVSSLAAKSMFRSDNSHVNELLEKLWMHSFACACLAKRIGEEIKNDHADTLFLMGIVHDIGKMLLIKAIFDIDPKEPFNEDTQVAVHEIHTTFGAVLLKKMRFTTEFIHISEFHHLSDFSKKDEQALIILNLSDHLARCMGYAFYHNGEEVPSPEDTAPVRFTHLSSFKQLELEEERLLEIITEMRTTIRESATAF